MAVFRSVLVAVVLLGVMTIWADAVGRKCYDCEDCRDDFYDEKNVKGNCTSCGTIETGSWRVDRFCSKDYDDEMRSGCMYATADSEYCYCNTDYCNYMVGRQPDMVAGATKPVTAGIMSLLLAVLMGVCLIQ